MHHFPPTFVNDQFFFYFPPCTGCERGSISWEAWSAIFRDPGSEANFRPWGVTRVRSRPGTRARRVETNLPKWIYGAFVSTRIVRCYKFIVVLWDCSKLFLSCFELILTGLIWPCFLCLLTWLPYMRPFPYHSHFQILFTSQLSMTNLDQGADEYEDSSMQSFSPRPAAPPPPSPSFQIIRTPMRPRFVSPPTGRPRPRPGATPFNAAPFSPMPQHRGVLRPVRRPGEIQPHAREPEIASNTY